MLVWAIALPQRIIPRAKALSSQAASNLSLSALKCGCGISRLAVHESIANYVAPYLLESTLCPLESFDRPELEKAFDKAAAVGLGMGFGREEDRVSAVKYALDRGVKVFNASSFDVRMLK